MSTRREAAIGALVSVPMHGYLILGGPAPIVVDSGFRSNDAIYRIGFEPDLREESAIEAQPARYRVAGLPARQATGQRRHSKISMTHDFCLGRKFA